MSIFGDLNQNFQNDCCLTSLCDIYGLKNLIKEPTCFKSERPTLIDVFLTDKPNSFGGYVNSDIGLSDFHNFTCVATRLYTPSELKRQIKYRSMKKFSHDAFIKDLECAPFQVCAGIDNIDDALSEFKAMYELVLNKHAPLKKRVISNKQVPHMNSKLRKARNQRNMWRNKHLKSRNNKHYRKQYVYWRNKAVSLNRSSIKGYFDKMCGNPGDSKKFL